MAIYVQLKKIADDSRIVKYSFGGKVGPQRTLIFDREEERIWPEDNNRNIMFRAAAAAVAKAWEERGELPDRLLRQS